MSILGIVDLVTIVPVFVALSVDPVVKSPTGFVRLYRVLMLARVRQAVFKLLLQYVCCSHGRTRHYQPVYRRSAHSPPDAKHRPPSCLAHGRLARKRLSSLPTTGLSIPCSRAPFASSPIVGQPFDQSLSPPTPPLLRSPPHLNAGVQAFPPAEGGGDPHSRQRRRRRADGQNHGLFCVDSVSCLRLGAGSLPLQLKS